MPDSLWAATAQPAPATPPLAESLDTDVTIVGGGYTGLSTALHLAEGGCRVCVLEASDPGWGASGRNGGQVIPGLKFDPHDLLRMFGAAKAEPLIEAIGAAAGDVFDLIERYGIDCDAQRGGWLQPAHSPAALKRLHARAEQWAERGAAVELLDRAAMARRLGTQAFVGGWLDKRAGGIQPLSYVRGLVRAAQSLGVQVHGRTLASAVRRVGQRWRIDTAGGPSVNADRVLLATNGYTGNLWPPLQRTIIAANSFIIATEPLSGEANETILPGGEVASDARRLLLYFRRDAQGRLLMGGRGRFAEPSGPQDFVHLERAMRLMFPQLGTVRLQYRWAGRVALTRDFLPHVHEPAPGATIALGYNGRGVAMATAMGRHLAARLLGSTDRAFPFPISQIRPIPLHALQRFYIAIGVSWYSLIDKLS